MPVSPGWPRRQPTLAAGADLALRPFAPNDIDDIVLTHQDDEFLTHIPVIHPYTRAKAERFALTVSTEMWAEEVGCAYAIANTHTNRLLGSVGVPHFDHETGQAHVGYWTAPWARRQGVASAGLRTISNWLLNEVGATRIVLHIEDDHTASVAVARAAGFVRATANVTYPVLNIERTFGEWTRTSAHEPLVCEDPAWITTSHLVADPDTVITDTASASHEPDTASRPGVESSADA